MDDFTKGWLFFGATAVLVSLVIFGTLTIRTRMFVTGGYCEHAIAGIATNAWVYWSKPPVCGVIKP